MREKLNSNPLVQMAVIGILLVFGAIFIFTTMGAGGEAGESEGSLSASAAPQGEGPAPSPAGTISPLAAAPDSALASRPLPSPVLAAWNADETVVLLIVHDGGIDDDLVRLASIGLEAMPDVATFVVPASKIARYAAITEGVGVERVPALVVMRPKRLTAGTPTASVTYGFQSSESIVQAVVDAGYKGPTVEYHP